MFNLQNQSKYKQKLINLTELNLSIANKIKDKIFKILKKIMK